MCCPVFVAVGDTQQEIDAQRADIARQIAFYGSTRTYRPVFETHGWGEVTGGLHALLERGDTDAMTSLITDEILATFSVSATWDGLAGALAARKAGSWTALPAGRRRRMRRGRTGTGNART